MLKRTGILFAILVAGLFGASSSFAVLGEKSTSVAQVKAAMKASAKVSSQAKYTVHELTSGINVVKEYVNADGMVFAVSWRGL